MNAPHTNSRLKLGVVGLGWVTTHRHIPVIQRSHRLVLHGVVDRSQERVETLKRKLQVANTSSASRLDEVGWLEDVDAVVFGTPPIGRAQLIEQALKAGKHVLTEKPFAMTVSEGEKLAELAQKHYRVLAVVHNFQFMHSMQRLFLDLSSGKLGRISSIHAFQFGNPRRRLPSWYEELPLGLYYDESPHFFYLLRRLCSQRLDLQACYISSSAQGYKTPALIQLNYHGKMQNDDPIPVSVTMNFESTVSEWHITLMGENYLADVDLFRDIYLCIPNDGKHTTSTVFRTSWSASLQHWGQHFTAGLKHLSGQLFYGNTEVFEAFADSISGKIRKTADSSGIDSNEALAVLRLQNEVLQRSGTLEK